jgi:hypothetical protein
VEARVESAALGFDPVDPVDIVPVDGWLQQVPA